MNRGNAKNTRYHWTVELKVEPAWYINVTIELYHVLDPLTVEKILILGSKGHLYLLNPIP